MEERYPLLSDDWLALLRCPVTGQRLRWVSEEEKQQRELSPKQPALITQDGSKVYGMRDGFLDLVPNK